MRRRCYYIILLFAVAAFMMSGCNSEDGAGESQDAAGEETTETSAEATDPYDEYIRSAIATVNGDKSQPENATPTGNPAGSISFVTPSPTPVTPDDLSVSSIESPEDYPDLTNTPVPTGAEDVSPTPSLTGDVSPSPTADDGSTPTPTPTPYITPDEFDVGKCCIYMNGESDSAFGTELITAINKARTDLGYKQLVTNKGLGTCADRRTREIAANFDHTRPNGLPFYSLAPEHFKAEMLITTGQKAEETVDRMIKTDAVSRSLIFTEKYQSIGASSFKTNGMQYAVVSFGL